MFETTAKVSYLRLLQAVSCFFFNDRGNKSLIVWIFFYCTNQILAPMDIGPFLTSWLSLDVLSFCQQGPRVIEKVNAGAVQCSSAAHDTVTDPKKTTENQENKHLPLRSVTV